MAVLQTVGYLLLALLLLMIMIMVHEFGHYITAKILGFKIYEFSIGMGKALYSKKKKNGEIFSIRMLPLGGYCSFGEDDDDDKDPNSFNNKAPWKRLIVLFSGAFFNFLMAIIFAVVLLTVAGYGRVIYLGEVTYQGEKVVWAEQLDEGNIYAGEELYTLTSDMVIETINGQKFNLMPTTSVSNVLAKTRLGDKIELGLISRDGATRTTVTIKGVTESQWTTLCASAYAVPPGDKVYHNFGGALLKAVPFSFEVSGLILKILGQLVTGQLGSEAIGGTVATVSILGDALGSAFSQGALNALVQICYLVTLISINLAVFNWLPIPSLDGARMVFVLLEWIRRKPINRDLEAKIHLVGIVCLLGFVVLSDVFWVFNSLAMHRLL